MKQKTRIWIYFLISLAALLFLTGSCKKSNDEIPGDGTPYNPNLTCGTLKDIDGNVYKTIKVGTQIWMAENLKTTKFNDGTSIPLLRNSNNWWDAIQSNPSYCWFMDDSIKYNSVYGALYNWFAVIKAAAHFFSYGIALQYFAQVPLNKIWIFYVSDMSNECRNTTHTA